MEITEEQHRKTVSTFQKKVNYQKRRIDKMVIGLREKNHALTLFNGFLNTLLYSGRITGEELVKGIKNKRYSKDQVKLHREKYESKLK